jgi:hypothetical protein
MPNPHRGEIEACLDGTTYRLCLTLRSLAELEHAFGSDDMLALAERFQKGRLSALDAQRIIGAGLRGAGYEILDEAVGRMQAEGGAAGFVDIVARLLGATFGGPAAPIAAAVAGEIISGLTDDLSRDSRRATEPEKSGTAPKATGAARSGAGTAPLSQARPSPLQEGLGVGKQAVGVKQQR